MEKFYRTNGGNSGRGIYALTNASESCLVADLSRLFLRRRFAANFSEGRRIDVGLETIDYEKSVCVNGRSGL